MGSVTSTILLAVGLFVGMMVCLEIGRAIRIRHIAKDKEWEQEHHQHGLGIVEGAVFGLLGLILAFTLSGAVSRFDARRQLIAKETNAVETAYLRIDVVSKDAQPELRDLLRQYLDARLAFYRDKPHTAAAKTALARSIELQSQIWTQAVAASELHGPIPDPGKLLLPAVNDMFDVTVTREMARNMHPPWVILALLFVLALGCSLLAGYRMTTTRRRWLHPVIFAAAMVIVIWVIMDIEYPRQGGLIRLNPYDQVMVQLQHRMK